MNSIISVVIGALIALLSSCLTNVLTYKTSKRHEERIDKRLDIELQKKDEFLQTEFKNKIIMSNREIIPVSSKKIIVALNDFYSCTQALVMNYPDTPYTGTNPELLFQNSITSLADGFPSSLNQLTSLDNNWKHASKKYEDSIAENGIVMSSEINELLNTFKTKCSGIQSYFYGHYGDINTPEKFEKMKKEYKQKDRLSLISSKGTAEPTHSVLNIYSNLTKLKKNLIETINDYVKETSSF